MAVKENPQVQNQNSGCISNSSPSRKRGNELKLKKYSGDKTESIDKNLLVTKSLAHLLYNVLSLLLGKIPKVHKICYCCRNSFPSESSNQTEILFRRFFLNNNIQCLFKAYYVTHIISLNHIITLAGKSLRSFPFYRCEHRLRE